MRKLLIKLLISFTVLSLISYAGINLLLEPVSQEAMRFAIENLHISNYTLSEPSFSNVRISSYNAITCEDLFLTATQNPQDVSKRTLVFSVKTRELTVEMAKLFDGLFVIHLKGLNISAEYLPKQESENTNDVPEAVREVSLAVPIRLNFMSVRTAAAQIRIFGSRLKEFSAEGKTPMPIELSGVGIITIKGAAHAVKFWVEHRSEDYRLVADRVDLKPVAEMILPKTDVPTPADIEMIAENPVKAPRLLKICSTASDTAANAHEQNPRVSEDAYRHVLWSFLLTREYGPDFAKEVTDAHELTDDPEEKNDPDAEAHHNRDLNNNEVGRKYAALGYSEAAILSHVMTDPTVLR